MAGTRNRRTFQGLGYFPNANADDFNPRPTTWKKILDNQDVSWQPSLSTEIKKAIEKKLTNPNQGYKPAIGDIIFFDSRNDGSMVIEWGNDGRSGTPGTGRFTHVSIVVDVNADGTALIAEAGGAGVKFMRQATIRNLQTGQVFRPENRKYAYQYAKMALDATKFDVKEHARNLESEVLGPSKAQAFRERFPDSYSWRGKDYKYSFAGPYATGHMLLSKVSSSTNVDDQLITKSRAAALHNAAFRKPNSSNGAKTSFNPWCSRFAMMAIAGAYIEMLYPNRSLQDLFPNPGNQIIDEVFARPIGKANSSGLRYISPKTLYDVLLKAKDRNGQHLFKNIASWINFDNQDDKGNRVVNYHYNGGDPSKGARPFLKNQFEIAYDRTFFPGSRVHEDGVTTQPLPEAKDNSPHFLNLKQMARQEISNMERACNDPNLRKILLQLENAILKANDYEDLLLFIAETDHQQGAAGIYHARFVGLLTQLHHAHIAAAPRAENSLFQPPQPAQPNARVPENLDVKHGNPVTRAERVEPVEANAEEPQASVIQPAATTTLTSNAPTSFLAEAKIVVIKTTLEAKGFEVAPAPSVDAKGESFHRVSHEIEGSFDLYAKKMVAQQNNERLFEAMLTSFYVTNPRNGKFKPKIETHTKDVRDAWLNVLTRQNYSREEIDYILPPFTPARPALRPAAEAAEHKAPANRL